MIEISFEINGRKVNPSQLSNVLERAVVQGVRDKLTSAVGNVRDPKTGEHPRLRVKGRGLDDLSIEVEGSPELIAEVKRRLSRIGSLN
jgi:hypothetical protein